jgi:hypothetical protein
LNELDSAVGRVLDSLDDHGYRHNTLAWFAIPSRFGPPGTVLGAQEIFPIANPYGKCLLGPDEILEGPNRERRFATDNGPEYNCGPDGFCTNDPGIYRRAPGSAVRSALSGLRGRKRDVYEGGHRIPSIISWPAVVAGDTGRVSWELVTTADFLPTIMSALGVKRPAHQAEWALDGRSILPLLKAPPSPVAQTQTVYADGTNVMPAHGAGWIFDGWDGTKPAMGDANKTHIAYRHGRWKLNWYGYGSAVSCTEASCRKPMLFDLATDLGETRDVSHEYPEVFAAILSNMTAFSESLVHSVVEESKCQHIGPPQPPAPPSSGCTWLPAECNGAGPERDLNATTKEACCGACVDFEGCAAAAFHADRVGKAGASCVLRNQFRPPKNPGSVSCTVCIPSKAALRTHSQGGSL